jgi:hypothetical protein
MTQKYASIYDWAKHAEIDNYVHTHPEECGIVYVEEFQPVHDPDVGLYRDLDTDGNPIPEGYIQVCWGEDEISLIPEDQIDQTCWIRYEWKKEKGGGEYHSDGNVYPSEEAALNGWTRRNEDTPTIQQVRDSGNYEMYRFVQDANDTGYDSEGYIFDDEGGYYDSIDAITEEIEYRKLGSDGK